MTALKRVSQKEMKRRTGFGKALGYSFPDKDEILIREDLPKKVEKEVIAHEEEHMTKGEEGPFLGALIGVGASLLGAKMQSDAAKKATRAQTQAADEQLQFAKESRDYAQQVQAPYVKAGHTALDALMSMTGLAQPASAAPPRRGIAPYNRALTPYRFEEPIMNAPGARGTGYTRRFNLRYAGGPMNYNGMYAVNEFGPENVYTGGSVTRSQTPAVIKGQDGYVAPDYPAENPGGVEGGYNFMTDPGYQFRFEEGQRALDRGAAARGGLLSGGYGRRAIRYGQGFASNEYTNVYNRIANIAGLGQVAGGQSGQSALYGAGMMGNAAGNAGYGRATGYAAQGDIWGNAISSVGDFAGDMVQDWWDNRKRATTPRRIAPPT